MTVRGMNAERNTDCSFLALMGSPFRFFADSGSCIRGGRKSSRAVGDSQVLLVHACSEARKILLCRLKSCKAWDRI